MKKFQNKKELFAYLIENKESLIEEKKSAIKHSDGIGVALEYTGVNKAGSSVPDVLNVKAVINTTNLMDSHLDVHLPGLWDKSLDQKRNRMHLQEHKMEFSRIIADGEDVKAYVKEFTWKEIGYDYEGITEALIYESKVKKERNQYMHSQYAKGYVKNHSVGMRYGKMVLAVNDEDYGAEFEAWEKYLPMVANKDEAEVNGYFWVITEATEIEGSAVPLGSNSATPTLEAKEEITKENTPAKAMYEYANKMARSYF